MLKSKAENPHATLITLFLNAVQQVITPEDRINATKLEAAKLSPYMPVTREVLMNGEGSPDLVRFVEAQQYVRDFDKFFERYMRIHNFEDTAKGVGLQMKKRNTVIGEWPMRLKKGSTNEQFEILNMSGNTGSERYVEWKRMA